jgi:hypothetical protein
MLEATQRVVQAAKKEAADHNWACGLPIRQHRCRNQVWFS